MNRRYKTGTKHVVQWLANAALQQGDGNILSILNALENSSAKLSTQNLVELSKVLAQGAAADRLAPEGIGDTILVLGDVIAGRRECANWYSQKPTAGPDSTHEDRSHKHFVGVLQHVLQCLKDTVRNSRRPDRTDREAGDDASPRQKLVNVYQALFVEEPQVEIPSATWKKKKRRKSSRIPMKVELESDGDTDKDFELWCFLRECYNIRQFVRDTWLMQQRGELSVDAASQVSVMSVIVLIAISTDLPRRSQRAPFGY